MENKKKKKIDDNLQVFDQAIMNISADGTDHRLSVFASLESIMVLGAPRTLKSASNAARTTTRESPPGTTRRSPSTSPCWPSQRPDRHPITVLSVRFQRRRALCVQTARFESREFDLSRGCSIRNKRKKTPRAESRGREWPEFLS